MFKKVFCRTAINLQCSGIYKYVGTCNSALHERQIHCGTYLQYPRSPSKSDEKPSPAIARKYRVITELNSPVIENTADETYSEYKYPIISDEFEGISLERKHTCINLYSKHTN